VSRTADFHRFSTGPLNQSEQWR